MGVGSGLSPHHARVRPPSLAFLTTLLDVIGLLLVAAGASAALWALVGPVALIVGGLIVLAGSALAQRAAAPDKPKGA